MVPNAFEPLSTSDFPGLGERLCLQSVLRRWVDLLLGLLILIENASDWRDCQVPQWRSDPSGNGDLEACSRMQGESHTHQVAWFQTSLLSPFISPPLTFCFEKMRTLKSSEDQATAKETLIRNQESLSLSRTEQIGKSQREECETVLKCKTKQSRKVKTCLHSPCGSEQLGWTCPENNSYRKKDLNPSSGKHCDGFLGGIISMHINEPPVLRIMPRKTACPQLPFSHSKTLHYAFPNFTG